jgi:dihydroorotase
MVEIMSLKSAQLLRIDGGTLEEGVRADITLIDPNVEWTVDPANFISKSRNSPFTGRRLKGRAILTIVAGDVVFDGRTGARA